MYAINHCELEKQIRDKMKNGDFEEDVMARAGDIIANAQNGKSSQPHRLGGVELVAQAVAHHVIDEGAEMITRGLGRSLDDLKRQAASAHISSC